MFKTSSKLKKKNLEDYLRWKKCEKKDKHETDLILNFHLIFFLFF